MKWIKHLEQYNISFNIHILHRNDSIIIPKIFHEHEAHAIYIVDGLIQLLKIFTNGENICTELLYKHNFFNKIELNCQKKINYYYKAIAIKKTIILIIPIKKLIKNTSITYKTDLWYKFLNYKYNNNHIAEILSHRNTKKRLIQLFLILIKKFGKLTKHNIIIPFYLSHYTLGTITGSQRVTINRIMNNLKKNNIINYNKQQIIIYSIVKLIQA